MALVRWIVLRGQKAIGELLKWGIKKKLYLQLVWLKSEKSKVKIGK